jgi:hypothetical protein
MKGTPNGQGRRRSNGPHRQPHQPKRVDRETW